MTEPKPKTSINYLSVFLAALAFLWLFSVIKACTQQSEPNEPTATVTPPDTTATTTETQEPPVLPPAIPGYLPLQVTPCSLKAEDDLLIPQLLMQFFRSDVLTANGKMTWTPSPKIDRTLYNIHSDSWTSEVICLQNIRKVGEAMERLAIIASNYPGNDCETCTWYIGWIKFTIEDEDPVTMVIRSSDRNAYQYKPAGNSGGQIGLAEVGPYEWAMVFIGQNSNTSKATRTMDLLDLKDFHRLLTIEETSIASNSTDVQSFDYLYFKPSEEKYYPLVFTTQHYWSNKDSLVKAPNQYFTHSIKTRSYKKVK
ncbi:MAG: hypothetical protein DHS20C18_43510 [Saprospiraceae bacterium]|nr:MAG: hypothetical protein DHS20C18_43510 [Saprospiraceae bacterium]